MTTCIRYSDLRDRPRLDAVLLDNVLAERRRRGAPGISRSSRKRRRGPLRRRAGGARNAPLRDAIDEILRGAMQDGSLEDYFPQMGRMERRSAGALHAAFWAGEPVPRSSASMRIGERGDALAAGKRRDDICRRCCAHR